MIHTGVQMHAQVKGPRWIGQAHCLTPAHEARSSVRLALPGEEMTESILVKPKNDRRDSQETLPHRRYR